MNRGLRHFLLPFLLILALGLALRLFQIGADGFWVDELGVAQAAYAPTLAGALKVAAGHVMAMPLDYVLAWGMGRISTSEGWLRLPEALWGILTLATAYFLYRDQIGQRAALWGLLMLALSPMLIKYSQELRFYAPLIFFYTTSTAIGLKAARENNLRFWLAFTLVTILGVFFHLYVAFAFINVVFYFVAQPSKEKRSLLPLTASFLLIFASAALAVAQFGKLAGEHSALFAYETLIQVVGVGLGFLPPFHAPPTAFAYGAILLILTLVGLRHLRRQTPLALALLAQVAIIIGLDIWRDYFASARQLLPLLPLVYMFTAQGMDTIIEAMDRPKRERKLLNQFPALFAMLTLLTVSFLVLIPYYQAEKTSTRSVLTILEGTWQPNQQVWVAPSYNLMVYEHYAPWLAADLYPFDLDTPADTLESAQFLLTDPEFDPGLNFVKLYQPPATTLYPQVLWGHP
jgi:4-amino-4-deoxy-L-arabinose transferase-like glycosyltransferase